MNLLIKKWASNLSVVIAGGFLCSTALSAVRPYHIISNVKESLLFHEAILKGLPASGPDDETRRPFDAAQPLWPLSPDSQKFKPSDSSPSGNYFTPQQLRHGYGFDHVTGLGEGQVIAIVDAYGAPGIRKGLGIFAAQYGIPFDPSQLEIINDGPIKPRNPGIVADWAIETSLDVEWAFAMAPKAHIKLVVSASDDMADMLHAVKTATAKTGVKSRARLVSMSWGETESADDVDTLKNYNGYFDIKGVTFFAATGDTGASAAGYPATSPFVVAVGGTTLELGTIETMISLNLVGGDYIAEYSWEGSCGGVSAYQIQRDFQKKFFDVPLSKGQRNRGTPDVAYNANPLTGYWVYLPNVGWGIVGGTSAGAPQWASFAALANQLRGSAIEHLEKHLYQMTSPTNVAAHFNDINDSICQASGIYCAEPNWDFMTGLGTPKIGLIEAIAASVP